jgi:hypothetical protein
MGAAGRFWLYTEEAHCSSSFRTVVAIWYLAQFTLSPRYTLFLGRILTGCPIAIR